MSSKTIILFVVFPTLIILAGVGYKVLYQPTNPVDAIITGNASQGIQELQKQPPIVRDDVQIETIIEGQGDGVEVGDTVSVHYTGTFLDGRVFDSSIERGSPFELTVGESAVIQGWHMGLLGMKQGGKRKLIIPPQFAYGEAGQGAIPPNTPLV
ncbi:MAG: FKBP-type peptidyl-prolyl cis-trans isomerase, partial [archaeon]|nr:FKBP-type peptidyl-prolyl cis-trans isomerase [archaeon]